MKAKVTHEFDGCADGEHYPRRFRRGDEIDGDLARSMTMAGYAKALEGAPENKALGGASQNKFRQVEGGDGRIDGKRGRPKKKRG